jgi:lipopolysaccharide/colanic/teichoic acid biosynthesis glycosyltransferase
MLKRLFDVILALMILVVASPLFLFGVFVVWLDMGRPIFFRQQRPGYLGRPFMLYKFRTMREAMDATGCALPDAERLTQWGQFLRRTSIDELPQLINVLMGDMSIVGPRPLLMEYLPLYSSEQMRRHEVRPGITGWAQVNGRNALGWEARFRLDVWYVDHHSFWLDIGILLSTVRKVFVREGINAVGEATMSKFTGCNE